jgi:hypothetical protein
MENQKKPAQAALFQRIKSRLLEGYTTVSQFVLILKLDLTQQIGDDQEPDPTSTIEGKLLNPKSLKETNVMSYLYIPRTLSIYTLNMCLVFMTVQ